MRVELLDERLRPLESFSGRNGGATSAPAGLECPVQWPRGDLCRLGGKAVRLQVCLRSVGDQQPRLYAVYLDGGRTRN